MVLFKTPAFVPGTDPSAWWSACCYQSLASGVGVHWEQGRNIFVLQHLQLNTSACGVTAAAVMSPGVAALGLTKAGSVRLLQ